MISRERLAELSRPDTARVVRTVAFDDLAAVIPIAARQVGAFSVALHDGAHRLLAARRV